ncbi:WD40-repeat-containing domain protein, partial [Suillus cothurnatus]
LPAIAFLLRDQHIITCSHDGCLQVIEEKTGKPVGDPWQYDKERSQICAVHVSPDGERVATGSKDGKIRVWRWNGKTAKIIAESKKHIGHTDLVCAVILSPDKRMLASVSFDRTLCFWDLNAKQIIGQPLLHSADLTCAAFAANGTSLATGTCDGEIYIW